MCGFAGVVAWDDRYRVSRETLGRMSASIAHRGPDGEGYHINHEGEVTPERPQVALAFRRLAILDPDPRSNQPFTDGRHSLVFNGEIYNFRELREELKALDSSYAWRTSGDTEVLLRAYAVWGEQCAQHLNGMYALAVWDQQERTLFLARDRMGQKPLYVAMESPVQRGCGSSSNGLSPYVAFASEPGALLALPFVDRELDYARLCDYLRWGSVGGTVYRHVRQLAPAVRWSVSYAAFRNGCDFVANAPTPGSVGDGEAVAETRRRVRSAVQRQLGSDVPLGCLLSGGIDSSVVALAMRDHGPVETFTVAFDDARYDESRHATAVAAHLGTNHHVLRANPALADDLPRLAAVLGSPFADSSILPTHYLCRQTRGFVKVALGGDGGDELFGGYDRYRAMRLGERLKRLPGPLRRLASSPLWQGLPGTHPKSRANRLKRFLGSLEQRPDLRYASYLRLFVEPLLEDLLAGDLRRRAAAEQVLGPTNEWELLDRVGVAYGSFANGRDAVEAALAVDRVDYLPNDLLRKIDVASMLHALEVRSPFMDHELVHFAAGLTTDQLLKGGPKRMLREAFAADLPDFVFKRKKMGFAVPIGEWFRGALRPMLRDHLFASSSFARQHFNMTVVERLVDEHEQARVDHSQRLYALLMLELWWRLQTPRP